MKIRVLQKPRKYLSSLIIDISNLSVMILLNSSQKDLLVEQKMISSTYIWHTNKSLPIFLVKSVESVVLILKLIFNKKIPKAFITYSWSLFEPMKRLMVFVYMVRIFFIFKARRLFHINFLLDKSVQEDTLDVHLIKLKIMVSSIGK
jgi:hypothetical protein